MTIDDAYEYVLNTGKHIGHSMRRVADSDLLHLEWMLNETTEPKSVMRLTFIRNPRLVQALELVCEDRKDAIEEALVKRDGGSGI